MNTTIANAMSKAGVSLPTTGILIVDHGSRRKESNEQLHAVAAMFENMTEFELVEPAHMEIAEPSIATGFDTLVKRGATLVIAFPYFLSPGRHWKKDVPALVAAAASNHPGVRFLVTAPIGLHPLMTQIMMDRIALCFSEPATGCEVCPDTDGCRIKTG